MEQIDKPSFTLAITALFETLGREVTEAQLHGYWIALADLTIEELTRAASKAMRKSTFVPVPAELRALANPTQKEMLMDEHRRIREERRKARESSEQS